MKKCTKCGLEKPLSEFCKQKLGKDGLKSSCKKCGSESYKNWAKQNWEKRRNINLKWSYGIDFSHFKQIKEAQNNKCAICSTSFENEKHTHLDHDHDTNKIRGILCNHCNRGLGAFKDSIQLLTKAIEYISHSGIKT
jgi:DNA-directed RNA polymerase subunit RPC12/RpoP